MAIAKQYAVAVLKVVIRQVAQIKLAVALGGEVTELPQQMQTALADAPGRQGGIVLGCNIEIVRNADVGAGLSGAAETGCQKTRLAPVVQREAEVG